MTTSEIQAERRETEKKSNVQYVSNLAQVVGMRDEDSFPNYHIISALKLPGIFMPNLEQLARPYSLTHDELTTDMANAYNMPPL